MSGKMIISLNSDHVQVTLLQIAIYTSAGAIQSRAEKLITFYASSRKPDSQAAIRSSTVNYGGIVRHCYHPYVEKSLFLAHRDAWTPLYWPLAGFLPKSFIEPSRLLTMSLERTCSRSCAASISKHVYSNATQHNATYMPHDVVRRFGC